MLNATVVKWIVWLVSIAIFSVIVVALGGGAAFIRRPVGVLYVVLWVVWGLVTALGRGRGVASTYEKSQRVFTAVGGPIMIALIVAAPWEYARFAGPIPRDGPIAWVSN